MIFYLFLVFAPWLLILFLVSTLWLEVTTEKTAVRLRLGISWQWSRYRLAIPLYRSRPLAASLPQKPAAKTSSKSPATSELVKLSWRFLQSLMPHVAIHIQGAVTVGTGDAAETGFLIGIIWQLLGLANAAMRIALKETTIRLKIEPEFNAVCLKANIRCIVFLPVLHIIIAVAQTIKYWLSIRSDFNQGGRKRWQSIPFKG